MHRCTELTVEQVATIVEDYFHRQGDHNAHASMANFGAAFFTVQHQHDVALPGDEEKQATQ